MKYQDKGQRQRCLSDQQWQKIGRASGLPSKARDMVESDIRRYLSLQQRGPAVSRAETREKLQKLRNQAMELFKSFEAALCQDDVYFALVHVGPNEWHPRTPEQRKSLAEHHRTEKPKADLKALVDRLDHSERELPRGKPGPSAESAEHVYLFVSWFDDVLHYYTSRKLTRSDHHRKMMEEIFEIVDREVGKGTIDTAMRRVCADTRLGRGFVGTLPGAYCPFPALSPTSRKL